MAQPISALLDRYQRADAQLVNAAYAQYPVGGIVTWLFYQRGAYHEQRGVVLQVAGHTVPELRLHVRNLLSGRISTIKLSDLTQRSLTEKSPSGVTAPLG